MVVRSLVLSRVAPGTPDTDIDSVESAMDNAVGSETSVVSGPMVHAKYYTDKIAHYDPARRARVPANDIEYARKYAVEDPRKHGAAAAR